MFYSRWFLTDVSSQLKAIQMNICVFQKHGAPDLFGIILLYWDLAPSVTAASTPAKVTVLDGTSCSAAIKHISVPVSGYFFGCDAELHIQRAVKYL